MHLGTPDSQPSTWQFADANHDISPLCIALTGSSMKNCHTMTCVARGVMHFRPRVSAINQCFGTKQTFYPVTAWNSSVDSGTVGVYGFERRAPRAIARTILCVRSSAGMPSNGTPPSTARNLSTTSFSLVRRDVKAASAARSAAAAAARHLLLVRRHCIPVHAQVHLEFRARILVRRPQRLPRPAR